MQAQAFLTAFHRPEDGAVKVRPIEIPESRKNMYQAPELIAELAYEFGQNDFQPRAGFYSVSMGDVITFDWDGKRLFYEVEAVRCKLIHVSE